LGFNKNQNQLYYILKTLPQPLNMLEFRQKKRPLKFYYSNALIFFLFVIFVLVLKGVWNIYVKERLAIADKIDRVEDIASLKSRKLFLENELNRLKTENGVEREIREKFNVKKEGENVAVIIYATTTEEGIEKGSSIIKNLTSWFSGIF